MIFDTGSNWLWIDSTRCFNCPYLVDKFDEEESSTLYDYETSEELKYGSGSVKGTKV